MIATVFKITQLINQFIWGIPALICILGVGLFLTFKTSFIQLTKFKLAIAVTVGKIFHKKDAKDGTLSPFQAVCTALAATVGTGNIAGVAGAIALGGPGAVFWMWCSAFLGMCTKFAEVTLAVYYNEKNNLGEQIGGPMYYIKNGLSKKWHFLAILYSLFGIFAVFGTGNATQVNTISVAISKVLLNYQLINQESVSYIKWIIGILIMLSVAIIVLGGIKRLGKVTEKLVPFMAILYIILSIGVILINFKNVPHIFYAIIKGAFQPQAITGGAIGSFFISMKNGISRGVFSNEAGLGTGSIAHASADTKKPIHQGFFGIFEVFTDTIVICTLTAFVILCSNINIPYGQVAGAGLTISGFTATYGNWVSIFTAISMCCFAFSTILGWGLYGARCIEYLFNTKWIKPFYCIYALMSLIGAIVDLDIVWGISDTFNGLMVIPNLIALLLLAKKVKYLVTVYNKQN